MQNEDRASVLAAKLALEDAGFSLIREANSFKAKVFGDSRAQPLINSTKGLLGHSLGASRALEATIMVLSIKVSKSDIFLESLFACYGKISKN